MTSYNKFVICGAMTGLAIAGLFILLLTCTGCAALDKKIVQMSDAPPAPAAALVSFQNQSTIAPPPTFHRGLLWDYCESMPAPDVAFDVEATQDLIGWNVILTTNQPPAVFETPNATEFYRLGVHWLDPSLNH